MWRPRGAGRTSSWRGDDVSRPWAVSAIATVAALGLVEAGFRVAGVPAFHPEDLITEVDAFRIVRHRSGLRLHGRPWGVAITTNRLGFRGREIATEKPAGTYRVVALGDSSTFGACVGDDDTFCAQAERILNGGTAAGGRRFEVVNTGVFGYGTLQGLRMLRRMVLPLKPDCIVVSFAVNDSTEGGSLRDFLGRRSPDSETSSPVLVAVRNALWNHSNFCRWVLRDALKPLWESRLERLRAGGVRAGWVPGTSGDYRESLAEIVRTARDNGVAVVFLPVPPRLKHTQYPLYEINYAVVNRRAAFDALEYMKGVIAGADTREQKSTMWFAVARLKEGMRDTRGALDAYLTAMSLSDASVDFRWGAYTFANVMAALAGEERVPLVNVLPEFYRRELTGNPPTLYADAYHPGPLGHEIIARALAAAIRDLAARTGRSGPRKGGMIVP